MALVRKLAVCCGSWISYRDKEGNLGKSSCPKPKGLDLQIWHVALSSGLLPKYCKL